MGNSCCSTKSQEQTTSGGAGDQKPSGRKKKSTPWSFERSLAQESKFRGELIRDVSHYQGSNLADQTIVRLPKSLNDQQYSMNKLTNCNVFLLDQLDSVVGDECNGCNIYIGPTRGSVFIRKFTKCKLIVACGQLRLRDCSDCDIFLLCESRPAVESSKNIRFGCFQMEPYFVLPQLFDLARLSVFNNKYLDVHDFTAAKGGSLSWSPLPDGTTPVSLGMPTLADSLSAEDLSQLSLLSPEDHTVVVPLLRQTPISNAIPKTFVLFLPGYTQDAIAFVNAIQTTCAVYQTRETPVYTETNARKLCDALGNPKTLKPDQLLLGPSVGLLIQNLDGAAISADGGSLRNVCPEVKSVETVYIVDDGDEKLAQLFFKEIQTDSDGFGMSH
eukprot:PhF_6_TR25175/c0_g1_i1/m.34717/K18272/RP2; protein XRP2